MERFIEEFEDFIRQAQQKGVRRPLNVITNYIGYRSLNEVRLFGLKMGILFTFLSPCGLYLLKVYCLLHSIALDLPETAIMNFCLFNAGSIMAFGFGSGLYTAVTALKTKAKEEEERAEEKRRLACEDE